jgi:hypothetical protein
MGTFRGRTEVRDREGRSGEALLSQFSRIALTHFGSLERLTFSVAIRVI